jgi:hypothetical protein
LWGPKISQFIDVAFSSRPPKFLLFFTSNLTCYFRGKVGMPVFDRIVVISFLLLLGLVIYILRSA